MARHVLTRRPLHHCPQETKEGTLQWLTVAVQVNAERAKMHPDLKVASTDGFMINLTGVGRRDL